MYLFTRAGRLRADSIREGLSFVTAITDRVNQETGLDVHSWAASMSPEAGTIVWATVVDTLVDLEAAQDKLAVSDQYLDLAERGGALLDGPLTDSLASVVVGTFDRAAPLPGYVTVARAIPTNGKLREAMAAGVEIAETATRITGVETAFLVDATGPFGGCRWNSRHSDIASVERAEAALLADERWMGLMERIGTAFQPGASQSMYRRVI
jgi:hypothetical protein